MGGQALPAISRACSACRGMARCPGLSRASGTRPAGHRRARASPPPHTPWLTRSQRAPGLRIRRGANALCPRHLYVTRRQIVTEPRLGLLKGCLLLVRFPGCPPRLGAVTAHQPPRLPALARTTSPCAITARRPPEPTTAAASHSGADGRSPHRAPASPSCDRRPGLGSDARPQICSTRGEA
jgi:hypothetical protein